VSSKLGTVSATDEAELADHVLRGLRVFWGEHRHWDGRVVAIVLAALLGLHGSWLLAPATALATPVDAQVSAWRADRSAGVRMPDPVRATPGEIARFFAGLTPVDRARLAARYPRLVGNLDGAPPALRFAANTAQASAPDHQLLEYDPRGDGRIAEVFGDLSTAEHIAIVVPGVGNRLSNFYTGLDGEPLRAPSRQAHQVYDEARSLDPEARIAVISWLGYDTPDGLGRDAIRQERATAGAAALARFVAGLAAHRPAAAVTIVGHSYGSVVAGLAARALGSQVRDLVAVGSPGMGVDRAVDLHTRARVWAGAAASDWIRRVPGIRVLGAGHGSLPTDASFGARALPVGGVADHDGYFTPGAASLTGIAMILLGRV
jgi:hypothetical protein